MFKKVALVIVLSGIATVASAKKCEMAAVSLDRDHKHDHCVTVTAPEIDPASAMGGLTLLLGGLVVLRGRRSKSSEVKDL